MALPYRDRTDAGRQLADRLTEYAGHEGLIVLALPRGGVPVAYEIAEALDAPLDVFLVRKLGVPGHEELAMGAIASGDVRVLNQEVIRDWHISDATIDAVAAMEEQELQRRERLYRGARPPVAVGNRTVILVDDGLATGSTMRAAAEAIHREDPKELVIAVPVAAASVCASFNDIADDVVCLATPEPFYAVGLWYEDFSPTTDQDVRDLLQRAEQPEGTPTLSAHREELAPGAKRGAPARDPTNPMVRSIHDAAIPLTGTDADYQQMIDLARNARFVLIGEASHGTEEFYQTRAELTKRLIADHGFAGVAIEGDWPDAFRVNRYVRDRSDDASADQALAGFERFPQWMWRNTVVLDFVEWLRQHNDAQASQETKTGFYGLDLYSLHRSAEAVIRFLEQSDPEAAQRARMRYACFDHFGDDPQAYGYMTSIGTAEPCEDEVVHQLLDLQRRSAELSRRDGRIAEDEFFSAEQNARVAKNAEQYYRAMFRGHISSWNLRDQHMANTLDELVTHLQRQQGRSRIVVWAHNSHLGDARATEMGRQGEWNLGQLTRQRHSGKTTLLGFTTYEGTVSAASDWDAPVERKQVRPALGGSFEMLFHQTDVPAFYLPFTSGGEAARRLRESRLERAIGVIYRPETERFSHYFTAHIADQFDAIIHIDQTHALQPLERTARWVEGELPETFPSAA
jgi:erythromycin esterase-like protein/predicted phosphoribosyltransferase